MRGRNNPPSSFICLVNIEDRILRAHPVREVKRQIDRVLQSMDATFEKLYAEGGRNSVPPERLPMALHSVRSERQFCERLPYDALDKLKERGFAPKTPGADKGCHNQAAQPAKGRIREGLPRARSRPALRPKRPSRGAKPREKRREPRKKARKNRPKQKRFSNHDVFQQPASASARCH